MRRIKIVFVIPSLKGGGAERVISYLVNNLSSIYFEPVLIIISNHSNGYEIKSNIVKYELNINSIKYSYLSINKIIKSEKPDILFSTLTYLNTYLGLLRFISPNKSIKYIARESTIPSINNKRHFLSVFYDYLTKMAYKKFDKIICQSADMSKDLIDNYNVYSKKIVTISNPIDASTYQQYLPENSLSKNRRTLRLVTVAMLRPEKGIPRILDSLALLDLDFIYYIIGDGGERNEIENKIQALGLKSKVKLLGFQSSPSKIVSKCDICLQGSFYEGFPNVLLEASLLGLPIVAFNCPGGTREVVENGRNGFLINDNSKVDFVKAIKKVVNEPFVRSDLSKLIQSQFGINEIINKYENVFLETLK